MKTPHPSGMPTAIQVKATRPQFPGAGWPAVGSFGCMSFSLMSPLALPSQLLVTHDTVIGYWPNQQVADEPDHQQSGQHVHGGIVSLRHWYPAVHLMLPDLVHQQGADDTSGGPRGQQPAMNGADKLGPEDVGQIGRDRREAAAVHGDDDTEDRHE